MKLDTPPVYLSTIDGQRFGISIARAPMVALNALPAILDFCYEKNVDLLIARCSTTDIKAAQAMEQEGFLLTDTLVYYVRNLTQSPIPDDPGKLLVRPVRPNEVETVKGIAAKAFRNYMGHYHADDRLDRTQCDEAYVDWAIRSCVSKDVADEVLVAGDNALQGFLTLRLAGPEEGEGLLFAVTPEARGHGVGRSLMIHAMQWCLSKGARRMRISTQITNLVAQNVWIRLGFAISHAYYTFHKWFHEVN